MKREGHTEARHRAESVFRVAVWAGGNLVPLFWVRVAFLVPTLLVRGVCEITKQLLALDARNTLPAVLVESGPSGVEVRTWRKGRVNGPLVWRVGAEQCFFSFGFCLRPFVVPRVILSCSRVESFGGAPYGDGVQGEGSGAAQPDRRGPEDRSV